MSFPCEDSETLSAGSSSFDDLRGRVVFLGTGTSHGIPVIGCECPTCRSDDPKDQRTRCSVVIGLPSGHLLIDTPPELRLQLLRERIGRIHAVVYTHEHADHLFGLDDLRIFAHYLRGDLPVYCNETVESRIRKAFDYAFDPATIKYPAGGLPKLTFRRISDEPFETLGTTVVPLPLRHGRFGVLGFRIGKFAYCTDTNGIPAETLPKLAGLKLLVLDCLRHRPHATHFSLSEAIAAAQQIGAERTLFTHLCHDLAHEATSEILPPGIELAYDGLRVEFERL